MSIFTKQKEAGMAQFDVRVASIEDAERIAEIHVACWYETYRSLLPDHFLDQMTVADRADMWRGVFAAFDARAFGQCAVLELDGEAVGFAGYCAQRDEALKAQGFGGEITAVYVRRANQGQGAGRLLMRWCAESLVAAGVQGAALWALRENAPARGFYERLGGEICGEAEETRDGAVLTSVAYGWADVSVLAIQ
ncbi:GNAT family N-acetyltransferase [Donghicola eburneus]|nr:GNAT family N-acetyltransferase [Donghicola eburneus]